VSREITCRFPKTTQVYLIFDKKVGVNNILNNLNLPGSSISEQNRLIIQASWLKNSFREGVQNVFDYYTFLTKKVHKVYNLNLWTAK
jgi:hypothetical protein